MWGTEIPTLCAPEVLFLNYCFVLMWVVVVISSVCCCRGIFSKKRTKPYSDPAFDSQRLSASDMSLSLCQKVRNPSPLVTSVNTDHNGSILLLSFCHITESSLSLKLKELPSNTITSCGMQARLCKTNEGQSNCLWWLWPKAVWQFIQWVVWCWCLEKNLFFFDPSRA